MIVSVSSPSMASSILRSGRRCNAVVACNLHQMQGQRYFQQFNHTLQDSSPCKRNLKNRSATPTFAKRHGYDIEKLAVARKRDQYPGRCSISTTALSASTLFSQYIQATENNKLRTTAKRFISEFSVAHKNSADKEYYHVTKIVTKTGEMETIQMTQNDIMMQTRLSPRDLVSLQLTPKTERRESWIGNTLVEQMRYPPTITTRNSFILLSLGPVRAVAEQNAVYIFDVHNKAARSFTTYLSRLYRLRSARIKDSGVTDEHLPHACNEEPTELIFLETVLADAVDSFSSRIRIFEPIVNDLLLRISTDEEFSDANLVHQLDPLEEQLRSFQIFVTQAYDCLMQLLNDDDAMLLLLLTEQEEARKTNTTVDFERHQHVEHILGIYARRFSSIIQEANYLLRRIESKQEFIDLELDLYRNRMIKMNVDLSILATATGVTTALTGTFGMNMVNGFEESSLAFSIVSAASAGTALFVAYYFRRIISGHVIQRRAEQRIDEIKTMSNALSDMTALDYTVKKMMKGKRMDKEDFKQQLTKARQSKTCTDKEIDLLFNVLNTHKDDVLAKEDFLNKEDTK